MRIKGTPRKRKTPRMKSAHYAYPTLEQFARCHADLWERPADLAVWEANHGAR